MFHRLFYFPTQIWYSVCIFRSANALRGRGIGDCFRAVDRRAIADGFDALSVTQQLEYLRDRETEFTKMTKKRRAEEEAQADWIENKRRKMEQWLLSSREGTSADNVTEYGNVRESLLQSPSRVNGEDFPTTGCIWHT